MSDDTRKTLVERLRRAALRMHEDNPLPALLREAADQLAAPVDLGLRERLADLCHEQWTGWMRYLFSRTEPAKGGMLIPGILVNRWQHQMDTPYAKLSQRDQDSDRKEADRILAVLAATSAARIRSGGAMPSKLDPATLRAVKVELTDLAREMGLGVWARRLLAIADRLNPWLAESPSDPGDYRQCPTCSGWVLRTEPHSCEVGPEPVQLAIYRVQALVNPSPVNDHGPGPLHDRDRAALETLLAEIARLRAERDGLTT